LVAAGEDVDPPAAEVCNKQGATVRAEAARRDGHPPRLVECHRALHPCDEPAVEVELVDVAARGRVVAGHGGAFHA
jgi:hypothetical protein